MEIHASYGFTFKTRFVSRFFLKSDKITTYLAKTVCALMFRSWKEVNKISETRKTNLKVLREEVNDASNVLRRFPCHSTAPCSLPRPSFCLERYRRRRQQQQQQRGKFYNGLACKLFAGVELNVKYWIISDEKLKPKQVRSCVNDLSMETARYVCLCRFSDENDDTRFDTLLLCFCFLFHRFCSTRLLFYVLSRSRRTENFVSKLLFYVL